MRLFKIAYKKDGAIKKHEIKVIFVIALSWTIIDFILFNLRGLLGTLPEKYFSPEINLGREVLLRELNVFLLSLLIGYLLVSVLSNFLANSSLWFNLFIKTSILVLAAFFMNLFIYFTYEWLINGKTASHAFDGFVHNMFQTKWLIRKMPEWVILFLFTLLALEVNQKYSRGVFLNIMLGRYLQPKEEKRIIMFLDLKDSTPIAERLGHKEYFKFIRDFIYDVSAGVDHCDGRVYQYVGDEIVVWWPATASNAKKSIAALIDVRRQINKNSENFRRRYDTLPEYKAGIHAGVVTVGQVGLVKKDLVMSGDAINTAARIRSACTTMNQKFIISKEMVDLLDMKEWQMEALGPIELKGKNEELELFALKI